MALGRRLREGHPMKAPACPFCSSTMRVEYRLKRQGWVCSCGFALHAEAKDVTTEQAADVAEELKR